MNRRFEPQVEELLETLRSGFAAADAEAIRTRLGVPASATDEEVATSLVQVVSTRGLAAVGLQGDALDGSGGYAVNAHDSASDADASFLGRLERLDDGGLSIGQVEEVATLVAILQAGSRRQRRAALKRLVIKLEQKDLDGDQTREAVQAITQLRDVELAYERAWARERLPGASGRKARAEKESWQRLVEGIEQSIRAFWDGQLVAEPLQRLPGDERARLLLRVPDLPELVLQHISAVVIGADGVSSLEDRVGLLASLRYAADRRLVPSLVSLVAAGHGELVIEAARVLGGIADPRVQPALVERYKRCVQDEERALVAGALGLAGDPRGAAEVRALLDRPDPLAVLEALEALESVGTTEDCEIVVRFAKSDTVPIALQAVRTLARLGDGRALDALSALYSDTQVPALRAKVEEALEAISARMTLRGEEAVRIDWSELGNKPVQREAAIGPRLGDRIQSWRHYWVGRVWLMLGSLRWALARFESAAARRVGWATPLVAMAMALAQRKQHAPALSAFRRALQVDRLLVERNPVYVEALAQCFLRRAEEVDREGRQDIARALVEEALTLDLRRAPSVVSFELNRLSELLRREGDHDRNAS